MSHTQLYHFDDTEFVNILKPNIDNDNSLSISGGMNSPWRVNINKLKKILEVLW
jgi:hypothetical protein